ncbi:riboflavin synthase [Candidatus Uhrbacteria bacterium]|nr:riboflavin synthase [Candidatus Uhrbacteria bacterium]
MFSGIIKNIGTIVRVTEKQGGREYEIRTSLRRSLNMGESVLIAGICSTVIKKTPTTITVFHMPETLAKTTSTEWRKGTLVNIEPSLRVGEDISGHVVSGHVDGNARVSEIREEGVCKWVSFSLSKDLAKYMIPKGSVAVDGVSLTVTDARKQSFSVALIPYTLSHTTLGIIKKDDPVNIEVDQVAKYIERFASRGKK